LQWRRIVNLINRNNTKYKPEQYKLQASFS
jgi:hypothetical protein